MRTRLRPGWMLAAVTAACVVCPPAGATEADPGVLISRQLAKAHGLAPGSRIRLAPAPADAEAIRTFVVQGIYEPIPDPMEISESKFKVRLHLPDLARLRSGPTDVVALESVDGTRSPPPPGTPRRRRPAPPGSRPTPRASSRAPRGRP